MNLLQIAVATLAIITLHVLGMAGCAAALGFPPKVVRLGFGPRLGQARLGPTRFELGLIPTGGFVRWTEAPDPTNPVAVEHPLRYLPIAASGCLLLVVVGLALGAPLGSFGRGFVQLIEGALHPAAVGAPLVQALAARFAADPLAAGGVLAMKVAAFNLFPLPGLNGGEILRALARLAGWRRAPSMPGVVAGTLLVLAFGGAWLAAVIVALRS